MLYPTELRPRKALSPTQHRYSTQSRGIGQLTFSVNNIILFMRRKFFRGTHTFTGATAIYMSANVNVLSLLHRTFKSAN